MQTSENAEHTTSNELTLSLADFPASHSVRPDDERARTIIATSGRKCYESYLLCGQPSSWQKTFLASCLLRTDGFSTRFTHRWKLRHTKQSRRLLFQLAPLARDIGEIEFGLLPTPVANDDNKSPRAHLAMKARMKGGARKQITSLNVMAKAGLLPTPCARDYRSEQSSPEYVAERMSHPRGKPLAFMVATPQSRDFQTGQAERWDNPARSRNLNDQAGGKLSVTFVEWLMGYPVHWTEL
jgi:hypothetical protein